MMKNIQFFLSLLIVSCIYSCSSKKGEEVANQPAKNSTVALEQKSGANIDEETEKSSDNSIGSPERPIRFYFTPSVSEQTIKESSKEILASLQKETGFSFEVHIPKDYTSLIEGFGNEQVDMAIMNSFGYILANKKYGAQACLRALRYGKSTYNGQIIASVESGINSIADMQGKRFVFTDSSSTSGFLFPRKILADQNIECSEVFFANKHDNVVKMIYEGKADAGATFYSEPANDGTIRDARSRVKDLYPDVEDKIKIITLTDPIPNDPVVFSKEIPKNIAYKISFALMRYAMTDEGKTVFTKLYGTEGFARCSDIDYSLMREIIENNNINLSSFL
ncbi:phosphate/phosphite/phosphonate ABC transporter substrate-binding protein [Fulvivirgaceae bacterium BMA10]|uniref:Phosphate/phosphite/phosphonate ABC transporter substrate-binding protein n=1 Tax=Splendidivirga corallicola TaxID=3051826 RepID=A0ABT8KVN4_9BACT|nr:phosphate/phosphite/phosphonate ABC transporter substrate-binding protein [Fulvivirgaceae bacterium BMA10]